MSDAALIIIIIQILNSVHSFSSYKVRVIMGKCRSCSQGKCGQKYKNRNLCDDPRHCTCTCQESSGIGFVKGLYSVVFGAAAFAGGVALTLTTGGLGAVGLAAVLGGGALTGVGATAVIHPIAKQLNGERMTGKEYVKDVAIGGTIGAITGPIGALGATATNSIATKAVEIGIKQGVTKFVCRTGIGAVTGAAAGVIQEFSNPGKFSGKNVLKGTILGAATGGVTHATSNITRHLGSAGIAKSVIKVAADSGTTAVIDSAAQLIENGEIDGKRLAINVGARAATTAGYETAAGTIYNANGGKKGLQGKMSDKQKLEKMNAEDKRAAIESKEHLEKMSFEDIQSELKLARQNTDAKNELTRMQDALIKIDKEIAGVNGRIHHISQNTNLEEADRNLQFKTEQNEKAALIKEQKRMSKSYTNYNKKDMAILKETTKMGDRNIHALDSEHIKQFAADLPDANTDSLRGKRRVIFDRQVPYYCFPSNTLFLLTNYST